MLGESPMGHSLAMTCPPKRPQRSLVGSFRKRKDLRIEITGSDPRPTKQKK